MNIPFPKFLSGLTAPAPRMPEPAKPVLPERYEYGGTQTTETTFTRLIV